MSDSRLDENLDHLLDLARITPFAVIHVRVQDNVDRTSWPPDGDGLLGHTKLYADNELMLHAAEKYQRRRGDWRERALRNQQREAKAS